MTLTWGEKIIMGFYDKSAYYQKFENITDDDIEEIKEKANYLNNLTKNELTRYSKYLKILLAIKSLNSSREFDKNVLLLMYAIDPELKMYTLYKEAQITSLKEIQSAKTKEEKLELSSKRKNEISEYKSRVFEEIGLYDNNLINYEKDYYIKNKRKNNKQK